MTSRVSIGWNRIVAQRPQQRGEPLDREDPLDQVVELGGAQHCVPDARCFQRPLDLCRKGLTPKLMDVDGAVNLSRMN